MSKVTVKTAAGICLALVLLFSMTTLALADEGPQLWYLDSQTTTPGYEMEKSGVQSGNVTIGANSSAVWLADQAAVCNVTFPGGDKASWIIRICTDDVWGTPENLLCEAKVGGWNTTTNVWYDIATTTIGNITWAGNMLIVELQSNPETIYQGDYLALEIKNNDLEDHPVETEGCSYLQSPCNDPGYPVAEVVSGILLGLGLVGLAGYTGWKRRKASIEA